MQKQLLFDTRTQDKVWKKNGKTSRSGQGSSEKSYDDKNRSDATGGCKSNPTRSAPRPDLSPANDDDHDDDVKCETSYSQRTQME